MKEVIDLAENVLVPTYKRFPILFERGKGVYLYSQDGKKFLDLSSGIGVNSLGYTHPQVVNAIIEQSKKLMHVSNLYYTEPMILLAQKLAILFGDEGNKVFFCNSGAEANEAALKLARRYKRVVLGNKDAYEIIAFKGSFHGRTMATVSVTGQAKYRKDFLPLLKGVKFARYNDIVSVERVVSKKTAAIIVEPVQGEGGVNPAERDFLIALREICDRYDVPLIFDEVQCGIGRTGHFFAFENFGVKPDIVTLAKALGGGLPIGAMIVSSKFSDVLQPGTHASTFGGNPVVAAAAMKVVEIISAPNFLQQVREKGTLFIQELEKMKKKNKNIVDVRGIGLMIGVELKGIKVTDVVNMLLEQGVVTISAGENVLRLLPPLIISKQEIINALEKIRGVLE